MQINQARFITACQQSLAVGVVVALLAPAANVVSLDVVTSGPEVSASESAVAGAVTTAAVPVTAVEPEVAEYALETTTAPAQESGHDHEGHDHDHEGHEHEGHTHGLADDVDPADVVAAEVSAPVEGYGAVGVTWSAESSVTPGELGLQVRTRAGEEWSEWTEMVYHDEHAPDPESADADTARGGTEAVVVGEVDEVEVRAEGASALPEDLQLAVVDPGTAPTTEQAPEIAASPEAASSDEQGEGIALRSASAPRPTIYSRAQWGADEKLRGGSTPSYGKVTAGFVHHTVNANEYTADAVPGIIRSIYAYHTKSRGWSDVGYNFLVDRFGRIWEGRFGGVTKAVIGAHTSGYNGSSFAMSAIGNFETAEPTQSMVNAYGSLMAWKLALHGVNAASTKQNVNGKTFHAINGHRDAGATACPGRFLYAKLPEIRTRATSIQRTGKAPNDTAPEPSEPTEEPDPGPSFGTPVIESNLVGTEHPDILVRRASDSKLFAVPTGGLSQLAKATTLYKGWSTTTRGFVSPDLTGDKRPDLVTVKGDGSVTVRPGTGKGTFTSKGSTSHRGTKGHSLLVAAGDVNADGRNDLVGRDSSGQGVAFLRTKGGKFVKTKLNRSWKTIGSLHAVGDVTGDGLPDLVARRKKDGTVLLIRGTGVRSFAPAVKLAGNWKNLRDIIGGVDFDGDGNNDIVYRTTDGKVWVLPGLGDGTFEPALGPIATNKSVTQMSVGSIHGNSSPDLLARDGAKVVVLRNTGKYEIGAAVSLKIAMPSAVAVLNAGDWNRDGKGDVMALRSNGQLLVRTGDGKGGLSAATVIASGFGKVTGLQAVGDVTGDGHPDLLGVEDGVTKIFPGQGLAKLKEGIAAPGFKAPLARLKGSSSYDATKYDWKITVSDLRLGKKTTDLIVRERGTGRLRVFENTTTGIGAERYLGRGLEVYDLAG